MIITLASTAFIQVQDDASGADDWRPLGTMVRAILLLVPLTVVAPFPIEFCLFFFPLKTFATRAIGATAAPFSVFNTNTLTTTRALFFFVWADVPTLPKHFPIHISFAPVHALAIVRD